MNKISRRNFIRASALSALGAAAAGALSGCSNNAASSAAASSVASSAAASEQPAAAASAITWDDIFATSYSQANRGSNPDAKAPETPEEYIEQKGNGDIMGSMMVGMVDSLNIPEEQFMNNKPAWLGDEPQLADKVEYTKDCEVLVIGSGQAGTAAALRCAEEGLNTICCEVQTWEEYDNYACDLTTYNSKFFLDKGAEKYDPMDIFTEYMVKALGHANQKIVKDYATRSGEALDWMLAELDPDYVAKYAHAVNYKGNKHFQNPCSHSYYYVGMTQWRDTGTETNTNNNMWPYTVRLLQQKAVEKGCEYIYGAQGLTLVHENGKVTGAIFTDIDGKYFQVNADAVIVAAGDFGGNPDMRLDLCDTLRNLAWSYGKDRTDVNNISSMGRDGSGIRMMLWAGATMEAGPRAGQAAGINSRPSFPFGGIWPIFGNDGKRFFNETITRHGSSAAVTMWPRTRLSPCAPARRTSTARTCRSTTAPTSPGTIWSCTRWSRWISARWIPSTIPNRCPTSPTASCGRTAATAWASSCCTAKRTSPATASVTRYWRPHAARCAMSSCSAARAGICWTMPLPRPSWPRRMNC